MLWKIGSCCGAFCRICGTIKRLAKTDVLSNCRSLILACFDKLLEPNHRNCIGVWTLYNGWRANNLVPFAQKVWRYCIGQTTF